MSELTSVPNPHADTIAPNGLGQIGRVVNAYVAPAKTFADIRRSASWWLPFLLGVVVAYLFTFAVQREVGFQKVAENSMQSNVQMQEKMSSMTPAQVQQMYATVAKVTRTISYAAPIGTLIFALVASSLLMASFNFGLGANVPYAQYLAVWFYAGLPLLFKWILASITLFTGLGADQFQIENPVGTNIGFYLSPDAPKWLSTLLSSADIFTLWTVILLVIGCATVAKVKRSSAAAIVVGWWMLAILGMTAMAALRS